MQLMFETNVLISLCMDVFSDFCFSIYFDSYSKAMGSVSLSGYSTSTISPTIITSK